MSGKIKIKTCLAICLFLLTLDATATAAGKIIYVDDDAPNDTGPGDPYISDPLEDGTKDHPFDAIQKAINAAEDGDTIIVKDGTYLREGGYQNNPVADFQGKAITVRSKNGPKNCILSRGDNVVSFHSGETPASILYGFTITGADPSGGILCYNSSPTIMNNIIVNNWSEYDEGAIYLKNSSAVITGNIICANDSCDSYGAGIVCGQSSSPTITNNAIVYNGGAGICGQPVDLVFFNNIVYANTPDLSGIEPNQVYYSNIGQERFAGINGNISTNPLFVNPNNNDYHLKSQAGRWNANEGRWTKDDVTSPCIDAGDPASPIGLEPFPNGGIINMGAYGGTAEASKSYFGEPICETIVTGDINGDCIVNFKDFALMAFHWLEEH